MKYKEIGGALGEYIITYEYVMCAISHVTRAI